VAKFYKKKIRVVWIRLVILKKNYGSILNNNYSTHFFCIRNCRTTNIKNQSDVLATVLSNGDNTITYLVIFM